MSKKWWIRGKTSIYISKSIYFIDLPDNILYWYTIIRKLSKWIEIFNMVCYLFFLPPLPQLAPQFLPTLLPHALMLTQSFHKDETNLIISFYHMVSSMTTCINSLTCILRSPIIFEWCKLLNLNLPPRISKYTLV